MTSPSDYPSASRDRKKADARQSEEPGREIEPAEIEDDRPQIKPIAQRRLPKPPSIGRRILDTIFGSGRDGIGNYILHEILIPTAQDTMIDVSRHAIQSTFRRSDDDMRRYRRDRDRDRGYSSNGRVSYDRYSKDRDRGSYRDRDRGRDRDDRYSSRSSRDVGDVILDHRHEAEEILEMMEIIIEDHHAVSVADLRDMLREKSQPTDNDWGWKDLRDADIRRIGGRDGGFLLDLPDPEPLRRRR